MADEKWAPQPYSPEELLSFDRLRRAVMNRVLDQSEALMVDEFPLSAERVANILADEWQRAKEAVRSSPQAREAFRKHLEAALSEQMDSLIRSDKDELSALGVAERSM